MIEPVAVSLEINGRLRRVSADGTVTLLTVLRDELGITSPKRGCNQGVCGACTVKLDGWPVRACLSSAAACAEHPVLTLEGLCDASMAALQRSFVAKGAVQCGFCTAGMLVTAHDLLSRQPRPTIGDVQGALSGNICRCTGYRKIVDAVIAAAEELAA